MPNPYIDAQRAKYDALRDTIKGLQQRAIDEDRDLTDDELRSVNEQADQAKGIAEQIESLTEIEQRNAKVSDLAASLLTTSGGEGDGKGEKGQQDRGTGLGYTKDRDPGHYTRSSQHSFFGDLYRSKTFNDELASRRLVEHQRALSTGTAGVGVVPPHWLTDEFEAMARQGRALANSVRSVPLGDDPRPLTLPKQTGSTGVAEQTTENTAVTDNDGYATDVDTVAPKPLAGKQTVSRQMLDMSNPAIDQLIYGDLMGVYNGKVESKVTAAVLAAGPAALSASPRSGANTAGDPQFDDQTLEAAIRVRDARKAAAGVAAMSVHRYGEFLKLKDGDGRPLLPNPGTGQAVNVTGVGSVAVDGIVYGLGIIATDGITDAGDDSDTFAVLRSQDTLLFESNMLRFRFEEKSGPESIELGIWGYVAVLVRQDGKGVQTVTVSAA